MKLEVEPDDVRTIEADGRGRINLGVEYADAKVTVAVTDVKYSEG